MREAGFRALNVAVTLGSKKQRQAERLNELRHACDHLGFELVTTGETGLERVHVKSREQDRPHWTACVQTIREILEQHRPQVLVFPHDRDWNSTHIGTHFLVMDALKDYRPLRMLSRRNGILGSHDRSEPDG